MRENRIREQLPISGDKLFGILLRDILGFKAGCSVGADTEEKK